MKKPDGLVIIQQENIGKLLEHLPATKNSVASAHVLKCIWPLWELRHAVSCNGHPYTY